MGFDDFVSKILNKMRHNASAGKTVGADSSMATLIGMLTNMGDLTDLKADEDLVNYFSEIAKQIKDFILKEQELNIPTVDNIGRPRSNLGNNIEGATITSNPLTHEDYEATLTQNLPEAHSPPSDEDVRRKVKQIVNRMLTSIITLGSVGIAAEALSLGQIESVMHLLDQIQNYTGLPQIAQELNKIPLYKSVVLPYDQIMNSIYTPYIPSASDLVRFRVREAISEADFKKYLRRQGYEDKWAEAYWQSHWLQPPNRDLFEMYHRGLIDRDTLKKQIIINDYHPDFVDKYMQLAERLPSRTELRMMSQRLTLDEEKVKEVLRAEGIREDWIDEYTKFVLNYRLGNEFSKRANLLRSLFVKGFVNEDELMNGLKEAEYTETEAKEVLTTATIERNAKHLEMMIDAIIYRYRNNKIIADDMFKELQEIGLDETTAYLLTDLEKARKKKGD